MIDNKLSIHYYERDSLLLSYKQDYLFNAYLLRANVIQATFIRFVIVYDACKRNRGML